MVGAVGVGWGHGGPSWQTVTPPLGKGSVDGGSVLPP